MYGLVGQSLKHSFSKQYFSEKFAQLGLDFVYENYECQNIEEVKELLLTPGIKGLNVTMPYKESVIGYLDEVDDVAKTIGAVNTICRRNGKWVGYNTDVYGFRQMIKPFFKSHHERAIIFGTGGASKSVRYVLEQLGCDVVFISRNPSGHDQYSYEDINEVMLKSCPILVNTTPVGTFPNIDESIELPFHYLTEKNLVIDLIYNPFETKFLHLSKAHGAPILNGSTMLHQQAEKAWEIWQT